MGTWVSSRRRGRLSLLAAAAAILLLLRRRRRCRRLRLGLALRLLGLEHVHCGAGCGGQGAAPRGRVTQERSKQQASGSDGECREAAQAGAAPAWSRRALLQQRGGTHHCR